MSNHPIPDWLRSQFSSIEDQVRKLGPCGVFTQMRTVTQTYFEQLAAAPQPPALGGEPERLMVSFEDHKVGQSALLEHIESLKKQLQESAAQTAHQQAEIERLKAEAEENYAEREVICGNYDQLKARNAELLRLLGLAWGTDDVFAADCKKIDAALSESPGD